MIIVHSENSTTQPEWHPNAVQRGTWAIYQTCVITVFLCVWTTIHLNIPRPFEKGSRQIWRKIVWSLLTVIAPEFVALNAWFQYRDAQALLRDVNEDRPMKESYCRHLLNAVAFACFAPLRLLDWLRISRLGHLLVKLGFIRDRDWESCKNERVFAEQSDLRREIRVQATMEDASLTWTMDMAFFVLSGGCVHRSRSGEVFVLEKEAIRHLIKYEPSSLIPMQQAVLQNPGKANTISKAITCVQAIWFCMQCITRINQGFAISLLELNTFSHCISALLIYIFWWHKPYDVESHVHIDSPSLALMALAYQLHLPYGDWKEFLLIPNPHVGSKRYFGSYLIVDENGNCLHVYKCDPWGSFETVKSKLSIPGTGLYLIADQTDVTFRENPESYRPRQWQDFWHAWLEMDRPVPGAPPSLGADWFNRFTMTMSYQRWRTTPYVGILGHGSVMRQWTIGFIMTVTFAVYGGLHLLAWQYSFNSKVEHYLWRISTVITMSTGLIIPTHAIYRKLYRVPSWLLRRPKRIILMCSSRSCLLLFYLLGLLVILSRAFLVIESFIALPNSPPSTYIIPTWSAYIPHI